MPVVLDPKKGFAWKTDLPSGHSSPIISGDLIFLTAAEGGARADSTHSKVIDQGGKLLTICLNRRTGAIVWKKEAPRPRVEQYSRRTRLLRRVPSRTAETCTYSSVTLD